jgi:hypothetical protein
MYDNVKVHTPSGDWTTCVGEKGVLFVFLSVFRLQLRTEGEIHQIEVG